MPELRKHFPAAFLGRVTLFLIYRWMRPRVVLLPACIWQIDGSDGGATWRFTGVWR